VLRCGKSPARGLDANGYRLAVGDLHLVAGYNRPMKGCAELTASTADSVHATHVNK
jgi:hypothetical protein